MYNDALFTEGGTTREMTSMTARNNNYRVLGIFQLSYSSFHAVHPKLDSQLHGSQNQRNPQLKNPSSCNVSVTRVMRLSLYLQMVVSLTVMFLN